MLVVTDHQRLAGWQLSDGGRLETLDLWVSLVSVSPQTAKLLSEMIINVTMNKTNPWVMEPWHVKVAFRKVGAMVPEEAITMPPHPIAGPDMALQGKAFVVKIKVREGCLAKHNEKVNYMCCWADC